MIKKEMIAMLLAGGQGSRLGVLTEKVAKPAVSFGGKYRIIDFPLSNCINSGIDTVGVLTQYQPLRLNTHIGIGIPWDLDRNEGGVTVLPPYEKSTSSEWYTGTANAIFQNMDYMEQYNPDYVLILSGDHIYKMDYEVMLDFHKANKADVTIACMPVPIEEASRFGIMVTDEMGRITEFEEKPEHPSSNLASMGIYIFSWPALKEALMTLKDQSSCDFGKHVLPYCKEKGERLFAYEYNGYWKDVGTLGSYWEANMELIDIIPEFNLYEEFWKIYTKGDIIRPQIVAGNAPDFICLNDGAEDGVILSLIKEHALLNLDDVFDGENYAGTGTLRDDITDGILSSTKCAPYGDDEIYLAPFSSGPQGLIYNKTFFEENNLEVPKTWDEFFTLGDTLKDIDGRALFTYQGIYPGYMEEMLWPAIANECGEEALTKIANYEEGSFNNEGVLKALSHIKEIADKGYLLEGTVGMNHTESQTEMMLGKAAFITNGTWMENEMQDAPREDGFEFAMAPIPTENADDVHYVFDSCEQFSIPAAAKNPELAKEFLRFLYSDESVSAFAEASGALYATKSAREVAKDKLSTAIYNMYGIYEEATASSLIMSFAAVPADCKVNPKDEIFNPITSVMNDEMTVEEWAQNVEDAFAQVRADMEAAN